MNALRRADITLSEEDHYMTMLVQTEVERIKFLVRSYIRTRLAKVDILLCVFWLCGLTLIILIRLSSLLRIL